MLTASQAASPWSQKVGFWQDGAHERALQSWGFFSLAKESGSCVWYFLGEIEISCKKYAGVGLGMVGDLFLGPDSLLSSSSPPKASLLKILLWFGAHVSSFFTLSRS